jgi:hypothetical protein
MYFVAADPQTPNASKKEKRDWAFEPLLEVLLDLPLPMSIANRHAYLGMIRYRESAVGPLRLRETLAFEGDREGRRRKIY